VGHRQPAYSLDFDHDASGLGPGRRLRPATSRSVYAVKHNLGALPGLYDTDEKTDITAYDTMTGKFYIVTSTSNGRPRLSDPFQRRRGDAVPHAVPSTRNDWAHVHRRRLQASTRIVALVAPTPDSGT